MMEKMTQVKARARPACPVSFWWSMIYPAVINPVNKNLNTTDVGKSGENSSMLIIHTPIVARANRPNKHRMRVVVRKLIGIQIVTLLLQCTLPRILFCDEMIYDALSAVKAHVVEALDEFVSISLPHTILDLDESEGMGLIDNVFLRLSRIDQLIPYFEDGYFDTPLFTGDVAGDFSGLRFNAPEEGAQRQQYLKVVNNLWTQAQALDQTIHNTERWQSSTSPRWSWRVSWKIWRLFESDFDRMVKEDKLAALTVVSDTSKLDSVSFPSHRRHATALKLFADRMTLYSSWKDEFGGAIEKETIFAEANALPKKVTEWLDSHKGLFSRAEFKKLKESMKKEITAAKALINADKLLMSRIKSPRSSYTEVLLAEDPSEQRSYRTRPETPRGLWREVSKRMARTSRRWRN